MENQVFAAALPPARGLGQLEQPTLPERGQEEIGVLRHGFNAAVQPRTPTHSPPPWRVTRGAGDSTMDPSTIKHRSASLTTTALGEQHVTWLRSLTGKLPQRYIAQPQLPARAGGKDRT